MACFRVVAVSPPPQKLLQNIQLKEQQKLLEQQLAAHLGQNPELLAQALKGVIPVSY